LAPLYGFKHLLGVKGATPLRAFANRIGADTAQSFAVLLLLPEGLTEDFGHVEMEDVFIMRSKTIYLDRKDND